MTPVISALGTQLQEIRNSRLYRKFKTSLRYKILSQKYKQTGAGEMAGWLKALATLTKDWRSSPSTHTGQLTLPVPLGACDLTLSSVL